MLILKRAQKTEAIIQLLQSYFEKLSAVFGMFDRKDDIVMFHSMSDTAIFNIVSGYLEPENVLNVAALLETAKIQGYPFLWLAHSSSTNLNQYLLNQDLVDRGELRALYYSLKSNPPKFEAHPAIRFVRLESLEQFYEWCHLFSQCYGIDEEIVDSCFRSVFDEGVCQLFLAQLYEKSVGCSAMYVDGDSALLLWDTVLPMYRRQGVGSMMVLSRMVSALDAGVENVYTFAMDPMFGTYKSLGYAQFAKFNLLRFDPRLVSKKPEEKISDMEA